MRRILAILLSVFMLVSVIAVPVSAREGEQEDKPYVFTEADNALIELTCLRPSKRSRQTPPRPAAGSEK